MKILLIDFLIKYLIWVNLMILGNFLLFDWLWSKLGQATITSGSLTVRT